MNRFLGAVLHHPIEIAAHRFLGFAAHHLGDFVAQKLVDFLDHSLVGYVARQLSVAHCLVGFAADRLSDVESQLSQVEEKWPRYRLKSQTLVPRIEIHSSWQDKQLDALKLLAGLGPKADEKPDSPSMLSYMQPLGRTPGKDTAFQSTCPLGLDTLSTRRQEDVTKS